MKTFFLILAGVVLIFSNNCFAQSAKDLFTEAQRSYLAGDVDTAKAKFKLVLQLDPNNKSAQGYMRMIAAQEEKAGKGGALETQLRSLILSKVELRDATFGSALEYLKQRAAKESEGKVNVSFVVQLPAEYMTEKKVTLNLSNTPFLEAVRYVCDLASATYSVEKFAVVIKASPASTPAK